MRDGIAVTLGEVSKTFRLLNRRGGTGTLKSEFVDWIRGAGAGRTEWIEVPAIRKVSLEIRRGETIGLIGRNGSGKSTLLKLIAGIHKPDAGVVEVQGRVSTLIELGAGFHPEITGRENVIINGMILGLTRREIRERYDEIVRFAEIEPFMDAPVRTYSSGMYARLGFSVAVHVNPEILLVDEVLSVGDEAFVHKCKRKFDEFRAAGKTIVIVTHDLATVGQWCDRAVWMEGGQIRSLAVATQVVDEYRAFTSRRERNAADEAAPGAAPTVAAAQSATGRRWGDGQIDLYEVRILDGKGQFRRRFETGEPMVVQVAYRSRSRIEDVSFGIALMRADGLWCFGSNTTIEGIRVSVAKGEGFYEVRFPSLDLLEGRYTVDVAAGNAGGYAYDYQTGMHTIEIWSPRKWAGVFKPACEWKVTS